MSLHIYVYHVYIVKIGSHIVVFIKYQTLIKNQNLISLVDIFLLDLNIWSFDKIR